MIDQTVLRQIVAEIEKLPEEKVIEVLDFVRFLGTRSEYTIPKRNTRRIYDEANAAKLYAEAAVEDSQLANSGITDYASSLKIEDGDAKG